MLEGVSPSRFIWTPAAELAPEQLPVDVGFMIIFLSSHRLKNVNKHGTPIRRSMSRSENWRNEARDEKGRWISGDASGMDRNQASTVLDGVRSALSGLPLATHDGLDSIVSCFDNRLREEIAAALPAGKADGTGVLADTLNQILLNPRGRFGRASPGTVLELRGIAIGLQPGQSPAVRSFAIGQLQDLLSRRDPAGMLGPAMREVEQIKLANIQELGRILENEAGSTKDQPIMEHVGHTVLNRMLRNETNMVTDVSGRYAHGRTSAHIETRGLAIQLLNGQLPDTTGGATHFYQPYAMKHSTPVPTDSQGRELIEKPPNGYESVSGVTIPGADDRKRSAFSVRPDWAQGMHQVSLPGIPDSLAKFFVAPGVGHVR